MNVVTYACQHFRNLVKYIRRHLPLISLVVVCILWGIVQFILPMTTMIRALFIPLGIALSVPLYYVTNTSPRRRMPMRGISQTIETQAFTIKNSQAVKGLLSLALLSVAVTAWFNSRFLPVFIFLFVGYMIVVAQLWSDPAPTPLLFELIVLFVVPVFTIYQDTDVFFGGGDTLVHIQAIDTILVTDTIAGIQYAGISYSLYPGLHLFVGTLAEITGFPTYDALVLAGITLIGTFILFTYAAINRLFDSERVALGSALGITVIPLVTYYTIYFYPQSMAVVLLSEGLYLYAALRTTTDSRSRQRFVGLTIVLVALMAITHHLTFLLFGIVLGVILGVAGLRRLVRRSSGVRYITAFPALLSCVVLMTYWIYSSSRFLERFIRNFRSQLLGVGTDAGSSEPENVMFGVAPPDEFGLAVDWLIGVPGIYYITFLAFIAIAAYELIDSPETYSEQFTFLVVGLLFAGLFLPLPFPVPFFNRFQWVVVLFAVIPLSVALVRLERVQGKTLVIVLLLVALLGGTSAFVGPVAYDVNALSGDERKIQVAYTGSSYDELGNTRHFIDTHADTSVTTRDRTLRAIRSHGSNYENYQNLQLTRDGLTAPSGILLVREEWTDHTVTTAEGGSFVVSEERFDTAVTSRNKIYTTGGVHGLWQREDYEGVFGP